MLEMFTIEPRAPLHHPARGRTARVEDAAEVRVDHLAPVVVGHAREQAVAREPRVVDEDVELAGLLDERAPPRSGFDDVGLDGAAADLRRDRLGLLRARAVADDDRRRRPRPSSTAIARPMPREPPVTSAVSPFERAEARSGSGERLLDLVRARRGCSPRSSSTLLSIRLTRPESTLPGPTSTKVLTPSLDEPARGLREAHRRRQLLDEQRREALAPARSSPSPST